MTHTSFPRRQRGTQTTLSSFPRKREPRGAGWLDPARLEHMLSSTHPSFPRRREPRGAGWLDPARLEYTVSPTHPSFPPTRPSFPRKREPRGAAGAEAPQPTPLVPSPTHPSFRRKACPVPDTGPESRGAAGAVTPQPTPLVPSLSKGLVLSSPKGPQTPHPSFPPRSPPKDLRSPPFPNQQPSNSTGTSQTPMAHPSTPHTPAAHPPGSERREPHN